MRSLDTGRDVEPTYQAAAPPPAGAPHPAAPRAVVPHTVTHRTVPAGNLGAAAINSAAPLAVPVEQRLSGEDYAELGNQLGAGARPR